MADALKQLASLESEFGFYRETDDETAEELEDVLESTQELSDRVWEELTTYKQMLYLCTIKDDLKDHLNAIYSANNHLRIIKNCAVFFVVLAALSIVVGVISFAVISAQLR